jgi:hypothetical protein
MILPLMHAAGDAEMKASFADPRGLVRQKGL